MAAERKSPRSLGKGRGSVLATRQSEDKGRPSGDRGGADARGWAAVGRRLGNARGVLREWVCPVSTEPSATGGEPPVGGVVSAQRQ